MPGVKAVHGGPGAGHRGPVGAGARSRPSPPPTSPRPTTPPARSRSTTRSCPTSSTTTTSRRRAPTPSPWPSRSRATPTRPSPKPRWCRKATTGCAVITHCCLEPHGADRRVGGRQQEAARPHLDPGRLRHRRPAGRAARHPGGRHPRQAGPHRRRLRQQVRPRPLGHRLRPSSPRRPAASRSSSCSSATPTRPCAGIRPSVYGQGQDRRRRRTAPSPPGTPSPGARAASAAAAGPPCPTCSRSRNRRSLHTPISTNIGPRARLAGAEPPAGGRDHLRRLRGPGGRRCNRDPLDLLLQNIAMTGRAVQRLQGGARDRRPADRLEARTGTRAATRRRARSSAASASPSTPGAAAATTAPATSRCTPTARSS